MYPAIELGKYQVQLRADPANFGEYLAILGLIALLDRRGRKITLGWVEHAAIIRGVDDTMVSEALTWLCSASVEADKEATVEAVLENAYPPLRLRMQDNVTLPLNHWLDEGLQSSSEWKLGAGQTTAHKTLTSSLSACSRALQHPDFATESLLQFGGRKVNADASKFRFDAATTGPLRTLVSRSTSRTRSKAPGHGSNYSRHWDLRTIFYPLPTRFAATTSGRGIFHQRWLSQPSRDCFRSAA